MPRKAAHEKSSTQRSSTKTSSTRRSSKKAEESKPAEPAPVPSRPVNRENSEHYTWGTGCEGWHLVKDEQLSVIEELMPPGSAETRHHHERAQQFFYVLSGELLIQIEDQTILIEGGSGIRVLPGQRHQVRNPSSGPTQFLVISQPPSHGDRVDEKVREEKADQPGSA
jgi:mannose-6-phosphate isomerase-like protein (cupin superfamily)